MIPPIQSKIYLNYPNDSPLEIKVEHQLGKAFNETTFTFTVAHKHQTPEDALRAVAFEILSLM